MLSRPNLQILSTWETTKFNGGTNLESVQDFNLSLPYLAHKILHLKGLYYLGQASQAFPIGMSKFCFIYSGQTAMKKLTMTVKKGS